MNKTETRIVLIDNLLNRMEYNSTQRVWKLSGVITNNEYTALQEIVYSYRMNTKEEKDG